MRVIAIVGAGGKTSLAHKLAEDFREEGLRVLLTTSTRMYVESGMDLSGNADVICGKLQRDGFCMAGVRCMKEPEKFAGLSEEVYRMSCAGADLVLVEADGAKHYPAKLPRSGEPVIPENVTEIVVVMGLAAVGRPAGDVIFRFEELGKNPVFGDIGEDTLVTEELLQRIMKEFYVKPLQENYPWVAISCLFSYNKDGILCYRGTQVC